jgi:hypothetical protein
MFEQLSGPCVVAGREAELTAILASLTPGLPAESLRGTAEQLRGVIQSIASTPAPGPEDGAAAWSAHRQGENFSLFAPDFLITATLGTLDIRGLHVCSDHGADWQIDFAEAMSGAASAADTPAPTMRIRGYLEHGLVSDSVFEADGRVTDGLDWGSRFREGKDEIRRVLSQIPSSEAVEAGQVPDRPRPEFADPPRSTAGSPGVPSAGGQGGGWGGMGQVLAGVAVAAAAGMAVAALKREAAADRTAPPSAAPSRRIRALAGVAVGRVFPLKAQVSLGRGTDNDIQVLDAEISRNHLRFEVRGDSVVVTDLGSSRGTLVDGRKIDRPTVLQNGQVVEVGHSKFTIEDEPTPAAAAPHGPSPTPAAEPAIWYFADQGTQQGPVTETALRQRLAAGLAPETLVWNSQLDNWKPAQALGLCPAPVAPKPTAPPPAVEAPNWFFVEKGVRQGPVTEAFLRQRLAAGMPPDTLVWHAQLDNWKPAHAVGLCLPPPAR